MNRIILCALLFLSCSKKDSADVSNNELIATVSLSGGDSVIINSIGQETQLGCNTILGSFVEGHDSQNRRISLLVQSGPNLCVSSTGNYNNYSCMYTVDTSTYMNVSSDSRNILTFTVYRDDYWEGYFAATCYTETDSVKVSGTFKGDPRLY